MKALDTITCAVTLLARLHSMEREYDFYEQELRPREDLSTRELA